MDHDKQAGRALPEDVWKGLWPGGGPMPGDWPEKAYKNLAFLNSPEARWIRVMCEFVEPFSRFNRLNVRDTLVFYGSARTLPADAADAQLRQAKQAIEEQGATPAREAALLEAQVMREESRFYEDARELARRMTGWSRSLTNGRRFIVCTGGGPGIMEAANRGAQDAGGPTIGLNISLPFEQDANAYQTPELMFEFHYFFTRKFWFVYMAKALITFPGGFGTLDELFELLTLVQTQKTAKYMPIVLYGKDFWHEVVDWEALVRRRVISASDLNLVQFCDSVDEAFDFLTAELSRHYLK